MSVNHLDIIRVTARMDFGGIAAVQNQFHFQYTGGSAEDDFEVENGIALLLDDAYQELVALFESGFDFRDILVWNVTQDRPMNTQSWPTLTVGTGAGIALPLQIAALVLFRTNTARSQGRKYLPPMVVTTHDGSGHLTTAAQTACNAWATVVTGTITTPNGTLKAGNWRYPTGPFSPWLTGTVSQYFRTQRRRVFGVGI